MGCPYPEKVGNEKSGMIYRDSVNLLTTLALFRRLYMFHAREWARYYRANGTATMLIWEICTRIDGPNILRQYDVPGQIALLILAIIVSFTPGDSRVKLIL